MRCYFVSDLHGSEYRYEKLFELVRNIPPDVLFIGGDILPNFTKDENFIVDYLYNNFKSLKKNLRDMYPKIFIILGNDDLKIEEENLIFLQEENLLTYINERKVSLGHYKIFGYSYVPPTPFRLKDWEKYDVSRFVDIGCISPEEGFRSYEIIPIEVRFSTIKQDLEYLSLGEDLSNAIFLFHSPPYNTNLDRLSNKIKMVEHVPMERNAGSIAIRNLIIERQPLLTLHGHIHESTRNSSKWYDKIGRTYCFNAANDSPKLSVISFEIEDLENATQIIL